MNRETIGAWVEDSLARVRRHPFIVAAGEGRLTRDQAERWILCAGRESRSFPEILRRMLARATDPHVRETLSDNLADELGNGDPGEAHFVHYLHLLDAIGLPREKFDSYGERSGIGLALQLAYSISGMPRDGIALGYMLVNEAMTPITYSAAKVAIRRHHPALATSFFDVHIAVDEGHVARLYEVAARLPQSADDDLRYGVELGERGMAALLDEALGVLDFASVAHAHG
jgi:pyrroloquinoline quinone (PQQ) biosynthesis protein C